MRPLPLLCFILSVFLMVMYVVDLIGSVSKARNNQNADFTLNLGDAVHIEAGKYDYTDDIKRASVTYLLPAVILLGAGIVIDSHSPKKRKE